MPSSARQRRVRAGRSASLERSALCADCPAVLGLAAPSPNSLRSLRSLHSNNRDESVEFTRRLKTAVRVTDSVARLAGDEFVVILDAIHAGAEAERVARKIMLAVREAVAIGAAPRQVTTSIGVALFNGEATSKSAGRDRHSVARAARPLARIS